jgi:glycerol kinase
LAVSDSGGSVLVVDVGTSSVRAAVVRPDATVEHEHHRALLPESPEEDRVEFDAAVMAEAALDVARAALDECGPVAAVGVANQRASTIVWDRQTGRPLAPGIGWQDLRTVFRCLELQGDGLRLGPNASATKLEWILDQVDPDRRRAEGGELCFGTVDTWLAWALSGGSLHVTDATNAGVTQLVDSTTLEWDERVLETLRIPPAVMPRIVDSAGELGPTSVLPGAPPLCALVGDQQASLLGQGCTRPGLAKATFGTGGMLDQCTGSSESAAPSGASSGKAGTIPIVAFRVRGRTTWGVEAVMLSAGSCVEWLRDGLGILATAEESEAVASDSESSADVWFVPALLGLGTPLWDFTARGTLVGLTRGTGRPEIVRAVLEGIAHRGADLVEAAEADSGYPIEALRVDGKMSDNAVFVSALADATGRPIEVSPLPEATTLGAGLLAGIVVGTYSSTDELAETFSARRTVDPTSNASDRAASRDRWFEARAKAPGAYELATGVSFF